MLRGIERTEHMRKWTLVSAGVLMLLLAALCGFHLCRARNNAGEELSPAAPHAEVPDSIRPSLSVTAEQNDKGETVFLVTAEAFAESFNRVYSERNGDIYLTAVDEWERYEGKTPFFEYDSVCRCFSADTKSRVRPTLTVYSPENEESIYELVLTFDDHGYQEARYQEYSELCFCALSVLLPELNDDEIWELYARLYSRAGENAWGSYHPDMGGNRPEIKELCRFDSMGLYSYYGAGTVNICISAMD